MLKAIFFDFDGTIVESADIKTDAFRKLFASSPQVDEIVAYHTKNAGVSRYEKFDHIYKEILGEPLSPKRRRELGEEFSRIVLEEIIACPLVAGAGQFLEKYSRNVKMYVLSSTPHEELRHIIRERKMVDYFVDAIGAPAKKSESAKRIMEVEGIKPEEALFIGDTCADFNEAGKASIPFIARLPRNTDGAAFPEGTMIIRSFMELDAIVEKILAAAGRVGGGKMKTTKILLSYAIERATPVYGNTPRASIEKRSSMDDGDSSDTYDIIVNNHTGTHVDAPAHFMKGGKRISEYMPEELEFSKTEVLDIPKNEGEWIEASDVEAKEVQKNRECILIKTGFWKKRDCLNYITNGPGLSPEAIAYLRKRLPKLRCIGVDCISITSKSNRERGWESHRTAFKKEDGWGPPLLLIEDMNLEPLEKNRGKIKKVNIVPWRISWIDSAPCTVIAEVGLDG